MSESFPDTAAVRLPRRAPKLADQVTDSVREMIAGGQLGPGVLYSVTRLAEELRVSRSPVREALLAMAAQGIVVFERNRGFRVRVPDPREIAEIFALRVQLEATAVSRAAATLDNVGRDQLTVALHDLEDAAARGDEAAYWAADVAMHDLLLQLAGNRRAARLAGELREETRAIGAGTTTPTRSLPEIAAEHRPVIDAVLAADGSGASAHMVHHLVATATTLIAQHLGTNVEDPAVCALWAAAAPSYSL